MKDLIIGIDAGTSVIKAIAFDLGGRQLDGTSEANEYALLTGAGAEQDIAATWARTARVLTALGERIPDLATRTAAIAVTGQGDGTWLIDGHGEPVGKGLLWLDARAAGIVDTLRADKDDRTRFTLTGTGLAACQQGPQLRWLREHRPDWIAAAAHGMHCKDWLYYCLTGEVASDPSEAIFTFGNFRTRDYDDDVIDILGLGDLRHLLPPIVDGTTTWHPLGDAAASQTGLLAGTPVMLGYVDVVCTALGAGLYSRSGSSGVTILGSTGMHMRLARSEAEVALNADATGYTMSMPIPGVWAQMQSNMAATLNIDWLLGVAEDLLKSLELSTTREALIARLDAWAERAEPARILYQPFISEAGERGPFIDAAASAGFVGLSQRHGFADLVRAVFEGLSFAARDCYTAMGGAPNEVCLSGGAARSRALMTILASMLGTRITTSQRAEAGAAGASMMAAVCLGHYTDMAACVDDWVTPMQGAVTEPDADLARLYQQRYPAYVASYQALQPVWRQLAATSSASNPPASIPSDDPS